MKRLMLLVVVLGLGVPAVAQAAITVNDDLIITDWSLRPSYTGGPFQVRVWDDTSSSALAASNYIFSSSYTPPYASKVTPIADDLAFCVQTDQSFQWNKSYNIAGLAIKTKDSSGVWRELSGYSAWVYGQFLTIGLTPSTTTLPGTVDSTDLINFQYAIWAGVIKDNFVPSLTTVGGSHSLRNVSDGAFTDVAGMDISQDYFNDHVVGTFINGIDGAKWTWQMDATTAPYKMIVLDGAQDQIFIGTGTAGIPEPATILIWSVMGGLGAAGAAVGRRKKNRHNRWSDEKRQAIFSIIER